MDKDILFHEKQHFYQWWIWLILIAFPAFSIYSGWQQYRHAGSVENVLLVNGGELLVLAALITFILIISLETNIREDGIYVRLFPFHLGFKHFQWQELQKTYVRKYSPLVEYGGWGLRWGVFGSGTAYNISGNMGLQLVFQNGKKILVGTQKAEECQRILEQLGQYKP